MAAIVALLRAVNVGGRWIRMADLTALFAELGFSGARTYVQSGNVVFWAPGAESVSLKAAIETAIANRFGFHSEAILRTGAQLRVLIAANPFPQMAADDPAHLVVHFSSARFTAADQAFLAIPWKGPEEWRVVGEDLFVTYPAGIGGSEMKLKLKTPTTARNWKSVLALAAMVDTMNSQAVAATVKSRPVESPPHTPQGDAAMAKGEQKPNKEKRKPKADKKAAKGPAPMGMSGASSSSPPPKKK